MKKTLVPVDFSKYSYQAVKVGSQTAKNTNTKLYITHIFNDDHIDGGIIEFSRLNNMDLITMNTHGRTGLARILNGSIAEGITNHFPLPVMSIIIADSKQLDNIIFPAV